MKPFVIIQIENMNWVSPSLSIEMCVYVCMRAYMDACTYNFYFKMNITQLLSNKLA